MQVRVLRGYHNPTEGRVSRNTILDVTPDRAKFLIDRNLAAEVAMEPSPLPTGQTGEASK